MIYENNKKGDAQRALAALVGETDKEYIESQIVKITDALIKAARRGALYDLEEILFRLSVDSSSSNLTKTSLAGALSEFLLRTE